MNGETVELRYTKANPFRSLILLKDKETLILCFGGALLYAGYTSVTSVLASQLQQRFAYTEAEVGLCYLPVAFGSLTSGVTTAKMVDRGFRKAALKKGLNLSRPISGLSLTISQVFQSKGMSRRASKALTRRRLDCSTHFR